MNPLTALLVWLATYHLAVGVLALAAPERALRLGHALYGVNPDAGPAATALMRPLGAYAVATGFLAARTAMDPVRFVAGVDTLAVLLLVRAGYRALAAGTLTAALGVPSHRNGINIALLLLQGLGLLLLRPR